MKIAIYRVILFGRVHRVTFPNVLYIREIANATSRTIQLFQRFNGSAKINMQHIAVNHQRRNRFHASHFSLGNPIRMLSQMNHIDFNIRRQVLQKSLFCGNTNRATCMIETSFSNDTSPLNYSIDSIL